LSSGCKGSRRCSPSAAAWHPEQKKEHFLFSIRYGMSSFPLTFIFFKMVIAPPTSICGWSNGTRHGTTSNQQLSGRFAANQFQGIHGQSEDLCLGQRHDAFDMA